MSFKQGYYDLLITNWNGHISRESINCLVQEESGEFYFFHKSYFLPCFLMTPTIEAVVSHSLPAPVGYGLSALSAVDLTIRKDYNLLNYSFSKLSRIR